MYKFKFLQSGLGEIQIDDFKEHFESDDSYWTLKQYEEQWKTAGKRLDEKLVSYFVTSTPDPKNANFIRGWACYPIEDELVFQERILFLADLDERFEIDNPHKSIPAYKSKTEDGEEISEWRTRV